MPDMAVLPVQAVELMKWERIPLSVPLHVGQERIIFVDRNVRAGVPPELKGKLRIQSAGGAVYLRPEARFPSTRLVLQDVENGTIILLDISAVKKKGTPEPVRLVYEDNGLKPEEKKSTTGDFQSLPPLPVALIRYAAQTLYAPLRTVEALPGVHPLALPPPEAVTSLLPSVPADIRPLSAWGAGNYSVTVLELRNRSRKTITLDPRCLLGRFHSAAFQHHRLGAEGTPEAVTVLYLVTKGRPESAFTAAPAGGKKDAD
ncbi:TIGR03749 family integrating conjugative element protein [Morganella morganii]|uniref:TIGR03749 family integrating conjugative element protein n=1 Tax=Morganella morganii TaxID=582 RepID=UPI001FAFFD2C|nr:TIGR03749 family integrating conjugative element protein [Morganella morganii]